MQFSVINKKKKKKGLLSNYYYTPYEFFTSALDDGLSLESEKQQISSDLQVSS